MTGAERDVRRKKRVLEYAEGYATAIIGALAGVADQWLLDPKANDRDRAHVAHAATFVRALR